MKKLEPIEVMYFNWLCAKVLPIDIPTNAYVYLDLLRILHKTEFVWSVSGDRNRAQDGVELRDDFLRTAFIKKDEEWYDTSASVLEVLIAFAKRAEFQTEIPIKEWFWTFLDNLDLGEYRRLSNGDRAVIRNCLRTFMNRTYKENGYGGLFPLRWPKEDQREVEIWYQFCQYVEDQGMV